MFGDASEFRARGICRHGPAVDCRLARRPRISPGRPTAESMASNTIQCGFESHPGHQTGLAGGVRPTRTARRPPARAAVTQQHCQSPEPITPIFLGCSSATATLFRRATGPRQCGGCRCGALMTGRDSCMSARAMRAIRPDNGVSLTQRQGCTEICSYSRHWPCLFPQHGPGKKHPLDRARRVAAGHSGAAPRDLARGLFHSDAYCGINRVRRTWGTAIIGMSIRGICSSTSRRTSCGCAGRRWTGWGWSGGFRSRTRSRSRSGTRWHGWMSSTGRSTELPPETCHGRTGGWRGPFGITGWAASKHCKVWILIPPEAHLAVICPRSGGHRRSWKVVPRIACFSSALRQVSKIFSLISPALRPSRGVGAMVGPMRRGRKAGSVRKDCGEPWADWRKAGSVRDDGLGFDLCLWSGEREGDEGPGAEVDAVACGYRDGGVRGDVDAVELDAVGGAEVDDRPAAVGGAAELGVLAGYPRVERGAGQVDVGDEFIGPKY